MVEAPAAAHPKMEGRLELSEDEIYSITRKVQPAAQLRHLKRMGIRAYRRMEKGREGSVCVLRDWLNKAPDRKNAQAPKLKSEL